MAGLSLPLEELLLAPKASILLQDGPRVEPGGAVLVMREPQPGAAVASWTCESVGFLVSWLKLMTVNDPVNDGDTANDGLLLAW